MKDNKIDMVFGECIHNNNLASCHVCNKKEVKPIELTKEDKERIEKAFASFGHDIKVIKKLN